MTAGLPAADKVLVIKLGSLGDVIQADGALRDIRGAYPRAEIVALTMPAYRKLLDRCPWVDRVLTDPRKPRWRLDAMADLRSRLRAERFGMVFDLQTQNRTNAYRRWFLPDVPWSGTAPDATHPDPTPNRKSLPSLVRLAGQLNHAGVPVRHTPDPYVDWLAEPVDEILADAGLTSPFVALVPGSSARHPQKRWPHYAALAQRLIDAGHSVATAPGPDELDLCRDLPGRMITGPRYLDYFQLAGFFLRSGFVIGNDTGPSHIAANLKRSGLVLFGQKGGAVKTGLDRPGFQAIERDPIADISVNDIYERVIAAFPRPQ